MDVVEALEHKRAIEAPCVVDIEELLALLAVIVWGKRYQLRFVIG